MAELILVRLTLFLGAFFVLRRLLPIVVEHLQRWHGLVMLGVATFFAFVAAALLLDDPMGESLLAWALITLAIAVIWFVRWKTMDYERVLRRAREAPDAPSEPL